MNITGGIVNMDMNYLKALDKLNTAKYELEKLFTFQCRTN